MGKFERAEAALAAARAIQSPGIIKVTPGSTVKREQPKGDASVREATDSLETAAVNFAKPLAQRRAEAEAAQALDATERLNAVKRANSEDNAARARLVAAERERNAKKYQNSSTFYGGSGIQGAGADFFGSKGGSFSDDTGSRGGSFSDALNASADGSTKASDFWDWSPPEKPGQSPGSPYYAPPEPMRQKAPEYTRRVEAAVTTMERAPEQTLDLQFQSQTEESQLEEPEVVKSATSSLPAFQSDLAGSSEVEALTSMYDAAPKSAAKVESAPAVEASLEDALTSAVRELGKEDGAKEGTLSNGARWWREEGKEYLEEGKVMTWTVIRGTSADGAVEWEEKFWETSDAFTYRELGAVKSGRDSLGQAWQESWKEIYQHDVNGTPFIHREASKWSHTPKGQCWSEGWTGGLPRGRFGGSVLRENGLSGGRRRAGGWPRQPLDREVGGEVGRARLLHQVDGHLGVARPRRGRRAGRARPQLGREVGGEVGRRLQRGRPRRDQAGRDLGRDGGRAQGEDLGGGALP
jgi:hypothetical protein